MRFVRRLLGWTLLLGCLAGLGVGVFLFVRHRPRCTIIGPFTTRAVSADGSLLVTMPLEKPRRGPVQIWDTRSGRVLHELFADAQIKSFECSPDNRHLALVLSDGLLRLVSFETGEHWCLDMARDVEQFRFSSKGRWLLVGAEEGNKSFLIDVPARKVVLDLKGRYAQFTGSDHLLLWRQNDGPNTTLWDPVAGRALGELPEAFAHVEVSSDGRVLVAQRSEPAPAPKAPPSEGRGPANGVRVVERHDRMIKVWALPEFKERFAHEMPRGGNLQTAVAPGGRRLAVWLHVDKKKSDLEMLDAATGKHLWSLPMTDGGWCMFSPDGSLCYVTHGEPKGTLTMLEAATGRALWERPGWGTTRFAGRGDILLHQEDQTKPLQFLDARTGQAKITVPLDFTTSNYIPMLNRDGSRFVIGGWQRGNPQPRFWEDWLAKWLPDVFGDGLPGVLVMEAATGRELLRVVNRGNETYVLSEDGSTLITIDPTPGPPGTFALRAWDVSPAKAWRGAVGAVLAAALVVGLVRWRLKSARLGKPS